MVQAPTRPSRATTNRAAATPYPVFMLGHFTILFRSTESSIHFRSTESSPVLPGMSRKFHDANSDDRDKVTMWGTGSLRRAFLHVDDLAGAAVTLLERYDEREPINIGVCYDVTIRELAKTVSRVVGYSGSLTWDTSMPDGTPQKLLDFNRNRSQGWKATIPLASGIESTYGWSKPHVRVRA